MLVRELTIMPIWEPVAFVEEKRGTSMKLELKNSHRGLMSEKMNTFRCIHRIHF